MSSEPVSKNEESLNDHQQSEAAPESQEQNQNLSDIEELSNKLDETSGGIDNSSSQKSQSTQIAENEARLEQLEKEHETLKSQYMRIAADFDNFRKRQSRDNDDLRIQLTCNTLSEILPVVDNFERARQQLSPEGEEAQNLHRSYQGLYKQLVEVLKKLGVAPMKVVGQSFDPNLHEAVLREPSQTYSEDIVTEELQRGYHLDGKVIRHALVKVSMGPGPGTSDKSSDNQPVNHDENQPSSSDEAIQNEV